MAKPRNPAGPGGRGGSASNDKESKASMKALQTNSAQIKSLSDAIENLTKVVAANAGTMKTLSTKEADLAKAIGEMKEDSFVESVIKRTASQVKQDDRLMGYALQALGGIGKMGLKGARAGISGVIDSARKRREERAEKRPSDFQTAKKKGFSDKQILAGFGGRAARNQMTGRSAAAAPPPSTSTAPTPTGASPVTPAGAAPSEGGGGAGLGAGLGGIAGSIGNVLGSFVGGAAGGAILAATELIAKVPPQFIVGMTYLTGGLGVFAIGMAGIAKIITLFGGEEAIKDVLTGLGEGLASFSEVDGLNLLAVGAALIPFAAGVTALGLALSAEKLMKFLGGGFDFTVLEGLGKSLVPFEEIDGDNLSKVGDGLVGISDGLAGLVTGGLLDSLVGLFTGGSDEALTNLAESLMSFQDINGKNLKDTGDGLVSLADAFKSLTYGNLLGSVGAWFTGNTNDDILTKLAVSLTKFKDVDGTNLLNVGNGLRGLADGLTTLGGANVSGAAGVSNAVRKIGESVGGGPVSPATGGAKVSLPSAGKPSDLSGSKLIEAQSNMTATRTGMSAEQFDIFRKSIASIESSGGNYGIMGGSSGKYAGAYQMGPDAMKDAAKALGIQVPSREEFLNNPKLQEQMFDAYTAMNDKTLSRLSPEYKAMAPEQKAQVLAYAHNQGAGGALNYMKTGIAGKDAFGTSGTKYAELVGANLAGDNLMQASAETANQPPVVAVVAPQTAGGGGGGGGGGAAPPSQPPIPPNSGSRGNLDKNIAFNPYADGLYAFGA